MNVTITWKTWRMEHRSFLVQCIKYFIYTVYNTKTIYHEGGFEDEGKIIHAFLIIRFIKKTQFELFEKYLVVEVVVSFAYLKIIESFVKENLSILLIQRDNFNK